MNTVSNNKSDQNSILSSHVRTEHQTVNTAQQQTKKIN